MSSAFTSARKKSNKNLSNDETAAIAAKLFDLFDSLNGGEGWDPEVSCFQANNTLKLLKRFLSGERGGKKQHCNNSKAMVSREHQVSGLLS